MRPALVLLLLALLLGLGACGGADSQTRSPTIPAGIAEHLATQSDAVADALDSGDQCGAAHRADDLRNAADEAIASGAVPAEFQADLESAVTELQNEVNCPPPEEHNEDKGRGKKKGHKKNEETSSGVTIGTTSTGSAIETTAEGND